MAAAAHLFHIGKTNLALINRSQGIPVFLIMAAKAAYPPMLNRNSGMLSLLARFAFLQLILMAVLAGEGLDLLLPAGEVKRQRGKSKRD